MALGLADGVSSRRWELAGGVAASFLTAFCLAFVERGQVPHPPLTLFWPPCCYLLLGGCVGPRWWAGSIASRDAPWDASSVLVIAIALPIALPLAVVGLGPQRCWLLSAASRGSAATILCPSPCTGPWEPQLEVVTVPQRFCCLAQAVMGCPWPAPGHRACCMQIVSGGCHCSPWEQHLYPWTGNLAQFGCRWWLYFYPIPCVKLQSPLLAGFLVPRFCCASAPLWLSSVWDFIQLKGLYIRDSDLLPTALMDMTNYWQ